MKHATLEYWIQGNTVVSIINVHDCFKPVQTRTNNTTNTLSTDSLYHTGQTRSCFQSNIIPVHSRVHSFRRVRFLSSSSSTLLHLPFLSLFLSFSLPLLLFLSYQACDNSIASYHFVIAIIIIIISPLSPLQPNFNNLNLYRLRASRSLDQIAPTPLNIPPEPLISFVPPRVLCSLLRTLAAPPLIGSRLLYHIISSYQLQPLLQFQLQPCLVSIKHTQKEEISLHISQPPGGLVI